MSQPVVFVPLTNGGVATIDFDDMERIGRHKWFRHGHGEHRQQVYARLTRDMAGKPLWMHREVLLAKDGQHVDHKNGDGLDNRKCNLRFANHQQNARNRRPRKKPASGYRGVYCIAPGKWQARWEVSLGLFDDPVKAAQAVDGLFRREYGEFANLNFPVT